MHILLVDDEEVVLRPVSRLLRHLGYTVTCAANGEEALECLGAAGVDLVISDIRMPRLDGLGLARIIRQRELRVPIVLVGGYVDEGTRLAAGREDVRRVLTKPLDVTALLAAIEEFAGGRDD